MCLAGHILSCTYACLANNALLGAGWSDIGYNFLIGEDGNVYEGRGWDRLGAHSGSANSVSLGYSVIGTFTNSLPNAAALEATKRIIACAVSLVSDPLPLTTPTALPFSYISQHPSLS